ncbi:MAG: hypothetical protein ACU0B7_01310 [Paracoccaceae bacterium]
MSKIDTSLAADIDTSRDATTETKTKTAKADPVGLILVLTLFGIILWGLAIAAFGIPGLYIPAVIAVPVVFVLLILISRG